MDIMTAVPVPNAAIICVALVCGTLVLVSIIERIGMKRDKAGGTEE